MDNAAIPPPRIRRMIGRKETEYPPPIPSMTRTENHPPRLMRRYYSGDGRLIIREEKVGRHEYLEVHRSNGRLVVNLVPLYDVEKEDGIHNRDEGKIDSTVNSRCSTCSNSLGVDTCGGFSAPAIGPPVHT